MHIPQVDNTTKQATLSGSDAGTHTVHSEWTMLLCTLLPHVRKRENKSAHMTNDPTTVRVELFLFLRLWDYMIRT